MSRFAVALLWSVFIVLAAAPVQAEDEAGSAVLKAAEALLADGKTKGGVEKLRSLLSKLEAAVPLKDPDLDLWTRARGALLKASKPDAALDALARKQADKLARVAAKSAKKNPLAARRAALAALSLVPTHKKALDALKKSRAGLAGKVIKLLDLPNLAQWTWLTSQNWPVKGGVLVGTVPDRAMVIRTHKKYRGDYDIIFEARLIEAFRDKGPPMFGLVVPLVGETRHHTFGYMNGTAELFDVRTANDGTAAAKVKFAELKGAPDPKSWIRYELRLRKTELIAIINGEEIGRYPRAADMKEGPIGIKVQCCKAEFRLVNLIQK